MTPKDTSDYELLLYADWLLDHGRDAEAETGPVLAKPGDERVRLALNAKKET